MLAVMMHRSAFHWLTGARGRDNASTCPEFCSRCPRWTPGWLLRNAPATPVSAQYGQRGIRAPSRPRAGGAECSARQCDEGDRGGPTLDRLPEVGSRTLSEGRFGRQDTLSSEHIGQSRLECEISSRSGRADPYEICGTSPAKST